MPTEDLIFDEGLVDDGLTAKGMAVLRGLVAAGYVQVEIRKDDLVLFSYLDHPEGFSDSVELGRINLYHVAGYSAQDLDIGQLDALATLFRNIASLLEADAISSRHPGAAEFSNTTSSPQIFPVDDNEQDQECRTLRMARS